MDHSTRVFASVFPVLSLTHTTPTPIATPDIGHTAPGSSFGSPYAGRNVDAPGQGHRTVKRAQAWSCATRFLNLPKDTSIVPRLHRTRDIEEALAYLLAGDGRSEDRAEESLVDWYTNECQLHFANHVRPALQQLWSKEVALAQSWDILEETQRTCEHVQGVYLQPFDEHMMPFLQHDGSAETIRPHRPSQALEPGSADAVRWKFTRDVHAMFAHSLPAMRYSKTLSYIIYDAGCRLFRIYTRQDGVQPPTSPEDTRRIRQRMTQLLQAMERVGLGGERAQKALAHAMNRLLDSFITSHYLKVDWYSKGPIVQQLRLWIKDGFCPLAELVLECLRWEQGSILPAEVSSWQDMALTRLGRARVENLFDFVINWDKSYGAIMDIKEYLKLPGAKQHLTSSFSQQVSRRLLQPGVTTTYILNVYIFIIRSFHELEPKGVLLERVARPIRRYLKEREDTGRIIISSLLTTTDDETGTKFSANSELSYEIALEMAKPISKRNQVTDEEMDWNDLNWQPMPTDASPEYKKSKVEDVIYFLLTLWEREDFINELKNILGDHLLKCQDPDLAREVRLNELIKIRLGEDKMQACEVMLRDVQESKEINAAIHEANATVRGGHGRAPQTPQAVPSNRGTRETDTGTKINAQILSSFFWPSLRDDTFRVPAEIDKLQKEYEGAFERIKGMRKLRWMDALGDGSITLEFDDRKEEFNHLTPWQVSIVHAFQPQPEEENIAKKRSKGGEGISRNVEQLEEMLEMDESLVRQALAFWVGKSVLREISPNTYAVIEVLPKKTSQAQADEEAAAAAEELAAVQAAQTTTVKNQTDLLNEKRDVYTAFIIGMLTAQGNMPATRIMQMMRIMIQGGFPFGVEEVRGLLQEMEAEGKVVELGGDVWGKKK